MKVMIKFELSVLNNKSYAQLTEMNDNLVSALEMANGLKESFMINGKILMASEVESGIIRINENIQNIKLVMVSKEGDVLESFIFGIEPFSLN